MSPSPLRRAAGDENEFVHEIGLRQPFGQSGAAFAEHPRQSSRAEQLAMRAARLTRPWLSASTRSTSTPAHRKSPLGLDGRAQTS